jgi:nitrous oxide reductase accessory protein NosL
VRSLAVIVAWCSATACSQGSKTDAPQAAVAPAPIGSSECAACGMVVREQPAPRAQLVHTDGTRAYLCSLGDLAHYQAAPSAHGKPRARFVEVLDPTHDPRARVLTEQPWVSAESASYVVGIAREAIMGKPALAYRSAEQAAAVVAAHGGKLV